MRTKLLSSIFITTAIALNAESQTASGGAATGGSVSPATGAGTANQRNSQRIQPGSGVVQPGAIRNPSQFPLVEGVATNGVGIATNGFGVTTNQFLAQTNQFLAQSNQFFTQTNQAIISSNQFLNQPNNFSSTSNFPPVRTGWPQTNGINGATLYQDRVFNQSDRTMLVQIHRNLRGAFGSPANLASVHFQVQNGVVTAAGTVRTMEQKQRLIQLIQTTPNVTQVIDQLQVNPTPGAPVSSTGFAFRTNQFGTQTLSPTGLTPADLRTNANQPQVPTSPIQPISNP